MGLFQTPVLNKYRKLQDKKAEAQSLKSVIESTDKEIDQMVYEL